MARAKALGRPGPYQIKAAIAEVHASAPSADATDWPAIVSLYDALLVFEPTPVVQLNRAVAVAMARGPSAGLVLLEHAHLRDTLDDFHLYHSTRAGLLRRAGRHDEATGSRAGPPAHGQRHRARLPRAPDGRPAYVVGLVRLRDLVTGDVVLRERVPVAAVQRTGVRASRVASAGVGETIVQEAGG